jgi:hypothetical protein
MYICLKKRLFEYLAGYPADSHGWAYVLASQVAEDTGISKEELWEIIQRTKIEAFLDYMTTSVPSAEGLISLGISQRGRLWLNGEDYSHIPEGREKVYNLL